MRALLAVLITIQGFCLIEPVYAAQSNKKVVDRMLLSVGQKNYSQRQFEIYIAAKSLVLGKKESERKLDGKVSDSDWKQLLESFRNEMILKSSAERESFQNQNLQLSKHTVDAAIKLLNANLKKFTDTAIWLKQFKVSSNELRSAVSSMLLVQAYLRRQDSLVNSTSGRYWGYQIDDKSRWFKRLEEQTPYRFYEGALNYQKLAVLP